MSEELPGKFKIYGADTKRDEVGLAATDALLCVGDTVEIHKRGTVDGENSYRWNKEMDKYDGGIAKITKVHKCDDVSYDIDIDGGEFGYMEHWLDKIEI